MKKWTVWVLVAAAFIAAVGLVLLYRKANESASPEVRRLAAVKPTKPPDLPSEPKAPKPPDSEVVPAPELSQPKPSPAARGVTSIQAIRDNPTAFMGKEVTVLGTIRAATYGEGIKDCAFTFQIEDSTSRAWVLPYQRTTPDLGRVARVRAKVVKEPDRPWNPANADSFFLLEKSWTYEK